MGINEQSHSMTLSEMIVSDCKQKIEDLKDLGNKFYLQARKLVPHCSKSIRSPSSSGRHDTSSNKSPNEEMLHNLLRQACIKYGEAIELVMKAEEHLPTSRSSDIHEVLPSSSNVCTARSNPSDQSTQKASNSSISDENLVTYKQTLFLNLSMTNLMLDDYEACRRCCNCCILFCNKPWLRLAAMGLEDDLIEDQHPVLPPLNQQVRRMCRELQYVFE